MPVSYKSRRLPPKINVFLPELRYYVYELKENFSPKNVVLLQEYELLYGPHDTVEDLNWFAMNTSVWNLQRYGRRYKFDN